MRVFLFFTLCVAVTTVFAQSETRTRLRGSRRFSLTSPGLQSSRRRGSQPSEAAENTETADATTSVSDASAAPAGSHTRSRGSSLLRRGRPSRLRGRTDPEPVVDETPSEAADEVRPTPRPTNGRGGLRIRRPVKKTRLTSTTTTTTTTTESPTTDIMPKEEGEMGSETSMKTHDKIMENVVDATETAKNEEEAPAEEASDPIKATKTKGLSRPKLRPIPIKIGTRKSAAKVASKPVPSEAKVPQEQEETTPAVSSHRFSSRPRGPRIQSRRRTNGRVTPNEQPLEQQIVTEELQPAQVRTRSRSRLTSRGTRLSSQRTSAAAEPAGTDVVQETPVEQPTESRRRPPMRKQPVPAEASLVQKPVINKSKRVKQQPQQIFEAPLAPSVREQRPPPRVAPEAQTPRPQFPSPNYGGSDLVFRGGEVHITQIGTIEDTPIEETQTILRGFGSRRRGLGRPRDAAQLSTIDAEKGRGKSPSHLVIPEDSEPAAVTQQEAPYTDADYLYDYYDYAYEQ